MGKGLRKHRFGPDWMLSECGVNPVVGYFIGVLVAFYLWLQKMMKWPCFSLSYHGLRVPCLRSVF